ncbi:MAG TPA: protein kinase [Gemmataceae bacterium]|nr:protein kinase [Gemmataceae bacterium]
MIAFNCPRCGASLKVQDKGAGRTGKCPACGESIQVPSAAPKEVRLADQPPPPDPGAVETAVHPAVHETDEPRPPLPTGEDFTAEDLSFLSKPQGPDEIGRLGDYRILKVLGAGGMGIVFQAEDCKLKRRVALKAMKRSMAVKEANRQRFLREAQTAASIEHEHIVTVYQVGEANGVPYLAMQLLQGESLEDRLKREGGWLSLAEVLRIGRELAEGLEAAHERGLVHRDVKPANIWLEAPRDRVKLVDFGLARAANENARLTLTGAVLGTPAYMAPEQASGQTVDHRCDLFSLGSVLYRLCTGQLPFRGKDTMAVLMALATQNPEPPRHIDPTIPAELSDLILHLLAKDPHDRPKSARAVADALVRIERSLAAPKAAPKERPEAPRTMKMKGAPATLPPPATAESVEVVKEVVKEPEAPEKKERPRRKEPAARPAPRRPRHLGRTPKSSGITQAVILGLAALIGLLVLAAGFLLVRHVLQ